MSVALVEVSGIDGQGRHPCTNFDYEASLPGISKLAIVITCYNYGEYVRLAIESVVAQASDDCEIVVIDDGSTDDSWNVITSSGVTAYRIPNSGQRAACIYGVERTSAPFVMFLDADDELKPGAIAKIIAALDPGVAKLQFPLTRIDAEGKVIGGARPPLASYRCREDLVQRVLHTGVYVSPPTSGNVFRRDVCQILREAASDKAVDGVILFAAPFFGDIVSMSAELGCYRIHGRNDLGLGLPLDPRVIERDMHRFHERMNHLRMILDRLGHTGLVSPKDTYFWRSQTFNLSIASARRPAASTMPWLIYTLWQEYGSFKSKLAMALFFLMSLVLPVNRARNALAYRYRVGSRSAFGLFLAIVRTS